MNPIKHIVLYKGQEHVFDNYEDAIHFKGHKKTAELFTFASIPVECAKLLDTNRKLNRRLQVVEHRAAKWRRRYAAGKRLLENAIRDITLLHHSVYDNFKTSLYFYRDKNKELSQNLVDCKTRWWKFW